MPVPDEASRLIAVPARRQTRAARTLASNTHEGSATGLFRLRREEWDDPVLDLVR